MNKKIAESFLQLVIAGRIAEAYEKYVDRDGKHHNLFTAAGFDALEKGMSENEDQFPEKKFEIKRVIEDGEIVATHSHLKFKPDQPGMTVVHIFRINNGKIVEFWDVGQIIPGDCPNNDGAF